jgi:hypothetical protein
MPMWFWIAIGLGSFVLLSLVVAFAVARILGTIGREISELYGTEDWATLPPSRASREIKEKQPDEVEVSRRASFG